MFAFTAPDFVYVCDFWHDDGGVKVVTAIFPAAGKGKRMQAGMNKVLVELEGVPILVRTLARFSRCQAVDRLVVVTLWAVCAWRRRLLSSFVRAI